MWLLNAMIIAIAMYSKIPMPRVDWNEKNMRYAMCFFPLVGVIIGAAVVGLAVFFYYYQFSRKQFGGITGDLAGYFLQLCELFMLAVLALF